MAIITGFWIFDVLAFSALLFAAVYIYFRLKFQEWEKRGFPVPIPPSFPSGNFAGVNRTKSFIDIPTELYNAAQKGEKVIGAFVFSSPFLVIRDLELAKNMLVKDFASFHDRGMEMNTKKDPLTEHIFAMKGQAWRNLRIKLTPTFTSGKMKMMFPTMLDVGKQLQGVLDDFTKDDDFEIKEILSRFTTDVISSVAFGLEANSLKNPEVEFRRIGLEMTTPNWRMKVMQLLFFASPWLANKLPINMIPPHITKFFLGAVQDTMEYRQKNKVHRNDFMQLLLQLKTLGYVKDADKPDQKVEDLQEFTYGQAAAQAFVFFFAGFETSSATMQFALYELALNPDLQTQVQREIDESIENNNGELTYESVMTMELLDRVMDETLRKYPVAAVLVRQCNKEYPIPGTKLTIKPGDNCWFPVYSYHHDPQYYPNPDKFDPDRFLPEVKAERPHFAFMPFGEGPRNCIGNRFALMQMKTGLAIILSKFTMSPSKKTLIPMEYDPTNGILTPKGKMHLKISKRFN